MGKHTARSKQIASQLNIDWFDAQSDAEKLLGDMATTGAASALSGFGLSAATDADAFHTANAAAVSWAHEHAGELITQISDSTREFVRAQVEQALDEGWTAQQLKQEILDGYTFSNDRALMIARSETTNAYGNANLIAGRTAGMNTKSWMSADDSCEDCQANEDAGPIPIDEPYPSGDDCPGAHPSCRCSQQLSSTESAEEDGIEAA